MDRLNSSVGRINGKCTVGAVRDDSYLSLTHTSTQRGETREDVTYLIAAGARAQSHSMHTSGRHRGLMGREFFISDWVVPTHSPKDTHTPTVGGVSICLPDSSLPVEIMYISLPGACRKSINGVYSM